MMLYDLKPRFQYIFRPSVRRLAQTEIIANQVTLCAAVVLGLWIGIGLSLPGRLVWGMPS